MVAASHKDLYSFIAFTFDCLWPGSLLCFQASSINLLSDSWVDLGFCATRMVLSRAWISILVYKVSYAKLQFWVHLVELSVSLRVIMGTGHNVTMRASVAVPQCPFTTNLTNPLITQTQTLRRFIQTKKIGAGSWSMPHTKKVRSWDIFWQSSSPHTMTMIP